MESRQVYGGLLTPLAGRIILMLVAICVAIHLASVLMLGLVLVAYALIATFLSVMATLVRLVSDGRLYDCRP